MIKAPQILQGFTNHARRGPLKNSFKYAVDFVLLDPESASSPLLFSRNAANVFSVNDRDHGGPIGAGTGADWARRVFSDAGFDLNDVRILLLTQPRVLGRNFNPVSFWFAVKQGGLCGVIAEVNNTFGDRHSYLCHHPGCEKILPEDKIHATKVFHVSPFQDVSGRYEFRFSFNRDRVAIRIALANSDQGVIANLEGALAPMTSFALLGVLLKRPFTPFRTSILIHWQALKLFAKGARYRPAPSPPTHEVSR